MNLQSFSFPPFSCPLSLSAGLFVCLLPLHSVYISVRSKTTHLFFKQRTTCLVFLICTDQNCSISSNRQHSLHFITVTYEIRIIYCLSSSFFVSLSLSLSFSLSLTLSLSLSLAVILLRVYFNQGLHVLFASVRLSLPFPFSFLFPVYSISVYLPNTHTVAYLPLPSILFLYSDFFYFCFCSNSGLYVRFAAVRTLLRT
jgi:hypothetical protein